MDEKKPERSEEVVKIYQTILDALNDNADNLMIHDRLTVSIAFWMAMSEFCAVLKMTPDNFRTMVADIGQRSMEIYPTVLEKVNKKKDG